MNIVLLGAPGAGKDTLAGKLSAIYGYKILTTGELYRKEKDAGTELGLRAYSYWGNGNLCPDDMTNELMKNAVSGFSPHDVAIFNGYPRTKAQAEYLDSVSKIGLALNIQVTDDEAIRRLLGRGRIDDTEEIIRHRLAVFHKNNIDIVGYYNSRLKTVDSNGSPSDVLSKALPFILDAVSH